MRNFDVNSISVNDVLHALRECKHNKHYEGMFVPMLTFASELTGISEDTLCSAMYDGHNITEDKVFVNRVSLIRERYSEREIWSSDYWVDAAKTPSKELFQEAVEAYLLTPDGQEAVKHTCNDFNWGDAEVYVPCEIWNQFGIYPFDYSRPPEEMGLTPTSSANMTKIQVDQDEVLIPYDYLDRLDELVEKKATLSEQIKSATSRAAEAHPSDKAPEKESIPER